MHDGPLEYLFSLEHFGIKFGLDNIRAILNALDHPERAFEAVHIAGTNGKGSVAAMVDHCLRAAGHRTGRYTSPHLIDVTERFVIDGTPVSTEELSRVIDRIRTVVTELMSNGGLEVHPTFFEVTTAAAFELFRRAGVALAVCEVGLGGRLDATNVLSPVAAAITTIARDHEQYLGRSLLEIAREKAGIVKPGVPVVLGDLDREVFQVIAGIAADRGAPIVNAYEGTHIGALEMTADGRVSFELATPYRKYGRIPLALAGRHQVANAIVAIRLLEVLDARGTHIPSQSILRGLADVRWPGRLEHRRLADGRTVLLDAAHNPAGAAALADFLNERGWRVPLVFAAMRDKDARQILSALGPAVSSIVVTCASNPRSAEPEQLAAIARSTVPDVAVTIAQTPRDALHDAWTQSSDIVVAGSIFLLGDVMKVLPPS